MKFFYSRLIQTGLTSSDSQRRAGIQDCFSCLFSWPLWKFFGSSHPPRHPPNTRFGVSGHENKANFRLQPNRVICLIYLIKYHVSNSCCEASLASLLYKHREALWGWGVFGRTGTPAHLSTAGAPVPAASLCCQSFNLTSQEKQISVERD